MEVIIKNYELYQESVMRLPTKNIEVYSSKAQTYVNFSYKKTATKTSNSQEECQFSAHHGKISFYI